MSPIKFYFYNLHYVLDDNCILPVKLIVRVARRNFMQFHLNFQLLHVTTIGIGIGATINSRIASQIVTFAQKNVALCKCTYAKKQHYFLYKATIPTIFFSNYYNNHNIFNCWQTVNSNRVESSWTECLQMNENDLVLKRIDQLCYNSKIKNQFTAKMS